MKILLDEMYTGMKEYLEAMDWEVETVNSTGLQGAEDQTLVEYAKENQLTLITQDEKHANIAELKQVDVVYLSLPKLAKVVDDELRKKSQ